jgi:hypothetical protein
MSAKKSRFGDILGAARGETVPVEPVTPEDDLPPKPLPPTPHTTPDTQQLKTNNSKPKTQNSKLTQVSTSGGKVTKSKSGEYLKTSIYLTHQISAELDAFISAQNLEAVRSGSEKLDRSDVIELLIQAIARLNQSRMSKSEVLNFIRSLE